MGDIEISVCTPADRREALELVLTGTVPQERSSLIDGLRPLAETGVDVFAALVVARRRSRLCGAAWLQPQLGRTATLWPSQVLHGSPGSPGSLKRDLAHVALELGAALPVSLIQALLDSPDDPFAADLQSLGFTQLAELLYLMLPVAPAADLPPLDARLTLHAPATGNLALFERLMLESYEGTLDCPRLEELRDFGDTLAGYQAVGEHDSQLWWLAYWEGEPAGVLLVAPYPTTNQWELIYMGLAPRFRGRGVGRRLLAELRHRACAAGIDRIVLAVDAANGPALKVYDQAGGTQWARRMALIKPVVAARSR